MSWYNTNGAENDVAISTRIRFARNIADYPFASRLDKTSAHEIIDKVCGVLSEGDGWRKIDFDGISDAEAQSYVESHLASPEFTAEKYPHVLLINDAADMAVMVCEEDHLRMQCIKSGLALGDAYKTLCGADDMVCDKLNIAFDDKLGFLTHCPTNLGTGMRASVMLFLPALSMTKQISGIAAQLSKLGLTLRGTYGEGSEAVGALYQLSNQVTLGVTEEETLKKLSDVITQIISRERQTRGALYSDNSDRLCDRIMRSLGTLRYAHMMSSEEFMRLWSDVRLGISLGIVEGITYEKLGDIMINVMPATLTLHSDRPVNEGERDRIRAQYIREQLAV